jgi:hypothetical protein
MFYTSIKRHIGGEGRAYETGIPPTSFTRSSAPLSKRVWEAGSDRCMTWAVPTQPPARPQTVTPGSTRGPTRKTVIARREHELPPRQGEALPKAPHPSQHPRCACRGIGPRFQPWFLPKKPPVVGEDVSVLSCSASERLRPVSPWFPTWETPPSRVPLIPGPKVRKKGCEPTVSTAGSPPHRPALAEDLSTLPCSVPEGLGFS